MAATVAIVEDEADLREAAAEYLTAHGHLARPVADGAGLRALVAEALPDLVVLDVAMPGEDGFALARWLRGFGPRPGIIFATAAGSAAHRVAGLEIGADDYIVKPFELRELLARVRSVLGRLPPAPSSHGPPVRPAQTARIGSLTLDLDRRQATDGTGRALDLTASEFDLLAAFASRPRRVLARDALAELVASGEELAGGRAMDIRVARLRGKLGPDAALIRTVRGEGYVYEPG